MDINEKKICGKKRLPKRWIVYISVALLTVLLNVVAWNSTAFCDAYIAYIFPIWVNTYGRLTGLFPFSVGEWLIVAGVLLAVVSVLLGVVCVIRGLVRGIVCKFLCCRRFQEKTDEGKVSKFRRFARGFYGFLAWIVLAVCVVMTLNCSILYHASTFSEKYFGEETGDYVLEEFLEVYNYVASECNRLSTEMVRDEAGRIVYSGNDSTEVTVAGAAETGAGRDADSLRDQMADEAIACLQALGETYPQLDGWYPRPKPMAFSDFMCQQYMCGYYFPFSMEANYNDVMYIMNKPSSMCHELAHLRGYIFEDEANFIAYLACLESEDPVFQYAGYLSVLPYLTKDINKAYREERELFMEKATRTGLIKLTDQVYKDTLFVEESEWERINAKAWFATEKVEEVSDTFTDTTLKLNGVDDGIVSYSRVVRLLLQYYAHTEALQP